MMFNNRQLSLTQIYNNHGAALNMIVRLADSFCACFHCNIRSFYLRGSIAYGNETQRSDMDIDIVVWNNSKHDVLGFRKALRSLVLNYTVIYPFDIKVFTSPEEAALGLQDSYPEKEIIRKFTLFELCCNGVCFSGEEIKLQDDIFSSAEDFKNVMVSAWGSDLVYWLNKMEQDPYFNDYYALAKRCLKLSVYKNYTEGERMIYTIPDCYEKAVSLYPKYTKDINLIMEYYNGHAPSLSTNLTKKAFRSFSKFILNFFPDSLLEKKVG